MTQVYVSYSDWICLGFFQSINPIIQYTTGKVNVVANALSWSQGYSQADGMPQNIQNEISLALQVSQMSSMRLPFPATPWW